MADEYQHASRTKLKLKNDSETKKKQKKKDKKKEKEKIFRAVQNETGREQQQHQQKQPTSSTSASTQGRVLTKAEESFKRMQEKMQNKRIVEKAQMTHKQRVELFNMHLDSLTEHFDIPKVSWTK
uniref:Uncharacterized protein n=1 Tax=Anopheles epiroticus TaxID=199890 RepID=A0A182PBL1_9DIPT